MVIVRWSTTIFILLVLGSCLSAFYVAYGALLRPSLQPEFIPSSQPSTPPPTLTATAAVVVMPSGQVIYEHNADTVLPIASITKLFAAARFAEIINWTATSSITADDVMSEGRSGRLKAGQLYQNHELLFPLLLESSNDAAAALNRLSPEPLVARMNTWANEEGAIKTTFVDTSGLGDGNISTARELATLFQVMHRQSPHLIDITTLPTYLTHTNAWMNNNPFVSDPTYGGGKQGYTTAAGRTVVADFRENTVGGEQGVVYVILGSSDLINDMKALRDFVSARR